MHTVLSARLRRIAIPLSVGAFAMLTVAAPNASAFIFSSYSSPLHLCDGGPGNPDGGNYPAHSLTAWHPLIAYRADGVTPLCTFGHEHGANPNSPAMRNIFGALPSALPQTISYPWATPNENCDPTTCGGLYPNKHRVYKWITFDGTSRGCLTQSADASAGTPGPQQVLAFREEAHADGNLGAAIRFHSFWIQALLKDCGTGETGIAWFGGHMDYSVLETTGSSGEQLQVPLPGVDPPSGCVLLNDSRNEGERSSTSSAASMGVWYGSLNRAWTGEPGTDCDDAWAGQGNPSGLPPVPSWGFQNNVSVNSFGPVSRTSPGTVYLYSDSPWNDRPEHDHTIIVADSASITTDPSWTTSTNGFTNRHGNQVASCSPAGPDCIPFHIDGMSNAGQDFRAYLIEPGTGCSGSTCPAEYNGDIAGPVGISANTSSSGTSNGYYVDDPSTTTTSPAATPTSTSTPVANATSTPVATHTSTPVATATSTSTPVATATSTPVATHTSTPVATSTPGTSSSTLGLTSVGTIEDNNDSNYMTGSRIVTGSQSMSITSITAYVGAVAPAPNNQFSLAIYADSGGAPGVLVAQTATGTLHANAWNALPIVASLSPNTAYWLMYNSNGSSMAEDNLVYNNVATNIGAWAPHTFSTWPTSFGTASLAGQRYSIYVH